MSVVCRLSAAVAATFLIQYAPAVHTGNTNGLASENFREEDYQSAASLHSDEAMAAFIRSLLKSTGREVLDEGQLNGFVPYFSGTLAVQNFEQLQQELASSAWVGQASEAADPSKEPEDGRAAEWVPRHMPADGERTLLRTRSSRPEAQPSDRSGKQTGERSHVRHKRVAAQHWESRSDQQHKGQAQQPRHARQALPDSAPPQRSARQHSSPLEEEEEDLPEWAPMQPPTRHSSSPVEDQDEAQPDSAPPQRSARHRSSPVEEGGEALPDSAPPQQSARHRSSPVEEEEALPDSAPPQQSARHRSSPMEEEEALPDSAPPQQSARHRSSPVEEEALPDSAPPQRSARHRSSPVEEEEVLAAMVPEPRTNLYRAPRAEALPASENEQRTSRHRVPAAEASLASEPEERSARHHGSRAEASLASKPEERSTRHHGSRAEASPATEPEQRTRRHRAPPAEALPASEPKERASRHRAPPAEALPASEPKGRASRHRAPPAEASAPTQHTRQRPQPSQDPDEAAAEVLKSAMRMQDGSLQEEATTLAPVSPAAAVIDAMANVRLPARPTIIAPPSTGEAVDAMRVVLQPDGDEDEEQAHGPVASWFSRLVAAKEPKGLFNITTDGMAQSVAHAREGINSSVSVAQKYMSSIFEASVKGAHALAGKVEEAKDSLISAASGRAGTGEAPPVPVQEPAVLDADSAGVATDIAEQQELDQMADNVTNMSDLMRKPAATADAFAPEAPAPPTADAVPSAPQAEPEAPSTLTAEDAAIAGTPITPASASAEAATAAAPAPETPAPPIAVAAPSAPQAEPQVPLTLSAESVPMAGSPIIAEVVPIDVPAPETQEMAPESGEADAATLPPVEWQAAGDETSNEWQVSTAGDETSTEAPRAPSDDALAASTSAADDADEAAKEAAGPQSAKEAAGPQSAKKAAGAQNAKKAAETQSAEEAAGPQSAQTMKTLEEQAAAATAVAKEPSTSKSRELLRISEQAKRMLDLEQEELQNIKRQADHELKQMRRERVLAERDAMRKEKQKARFSAVERDLAQVTKLAEQELVELRAQLKGQRLPPMDPAPEAMPDVHEP